MYIVGPLGVNLWFNFNNSESKAVILEVLPVLSRVVGQASVGYEGRFTQPSSSLSICHPTSGFNPFFLVNLIVSMA